jgi:hypothetical protein
MASSREVLEKVSVAFAQEFHIPYPSVSDPSGQIRDGLGFIGQPYTIFFGAAGSRTSHVVGTARPAHPVDEHRRLLSMSTSLSATGSG